MIPKREVTDFQPGDKVTVRVTNVKEDGKLDLSAGRKAYLQLGTDAEAVLGKKSEKIIRASCHLTIKRIRRRSMRLSDFQKPHLRGLSGTFIRSTR